MTERYLALLDFSNPADSKPDFVLVDSRILQRVLDMTQFKRNNWRKQDFIAIYVSL